jgi:hypothetical protein
MASATQTTFDRDKMAKWYAKRHSEIDSGVYEINYLPKGAPEREIRFLEINRSIAETADPEPIDFGVDTGSADAHTLLVLDLTPAQWDAVQKKKLPLPAGWTLEDAQRLFKR